MRIIRNGGWKFFLIIFAPVILFMFVVFWILDFYLKDVEELEKAKEKE